MLSNLVSSHGVFISGAILLIAYIFIAMEKIQKSVVALLGAAATLLLGLLPFKGYINQETGTYVKAVFDYIEFDTKNDTPKLVGKKVLCEVIHVEGTRPNEDGKLPVFANIKKILKLVEEESDSPRNSIASNDDDDLD